MACEQEDLTGILGLITGLADIHHYFESDAFRGVSVKFTNVADAEHAANKLLETPAVKNKWPVRRYERPAVRTTWTGTNPPQQSQGLTHVAQRDNSTISGYSPHVMTQIDKLHAKGYTGNGAYIAVIDTGVCFPPLIFSAKATIHTND